MAEYILEDWYGKEQTFDKETIYVQGKDGELMPFTHGTGSSAELRYVTFMSYDGLIEYGKKAVAVGDDCADPIARGVFATPTRESDVQYNYTFYGWATAPNGGADADALKAVNEDRTVYANFSSAVRYYTITYYDSDGTTVLKTESLAFGATPSYKPQKEGVIFAGWTIDIMPVTGPASYTATWSEKLTFEGAAWSDIARISENGEAKQHFAIGDTKRITFGSYTWTFKIIGFDAETIHDSTQKAGITVAVNELVKTRQQMNSTKTASGGWASSEMRSYLNETLLATAPSDLQAVIKTVTKPYNDENSGLVRNCGDKLWLFSNTEIGGTVEYQNADVSLGVMYLDFDKTSYGTNYSFWLRTANKSKVGEFLRVVYSNNTFKTTVSPANGNTGWSPKAYTVFAFCI